MVPRKLGSCLQEKTGNILKLPESAVLIIEGIFGLHPKFLAAFEDVSLFKVAWHRTRGASCAFSRFFWRVRRNEQGWKDVRLFRAAGPRLQHIDMYPHCRESAQKMCNSGDTCLLCFVLCLLQRCLSGLGPGRASEISAWCQSLAVKRRKGIPGPLTNSEGDSTKALQLHEQGSASDCCQEG